MHKLIPLLLLVAALPSWAQFSYPASASTRIYLGHFADGGPAGQKWATTLVLNNPNTAAAAPVKVSFYDDGGRPLPMDFGQGASAVLYLTVPAGGAKLLTSTGASTTTVGGWAILETPDAPSTAPATPVVASLLFRATQAGGQVLDVASPGTGSTYFYSSYANGSLGVALANPSATATIHVQLAALRDDGTPTTPSGPWTITLPPRGHTAFNLYSPSIGLPQSFSGNISLSSADDPPTGFVALALNFRDPVLSTLPSGESVAPAPYDRRPTDVALKVRQAAAAIVLQASPYTGDIPPAEISRLISLMGLVIDNDTSIKASFSAGDNSVHLSTGLIEMAGASDAALAFVIGHMAARGILLRTGTPTTGLFAGDPEGLADAAGVGTLLAGGFDPGGAGDFYGRLLTASLQGLTIDSALKTEFSIPAGVSARLQKMWSYIIVGCVASTSLTQTCQKARKYWHPHNPTNIP